jgi:NADH dehydrogenase
MILVVGATGQLGGLIVRKLRERGESVRALVRDPAASVGLNEGASGGGGDGGRDGEGELEVVVGDLKDPDSLRRACAGVSTVVTTANALARGGADTIETVDKTGNANLIDAAAEQGVERFVFVSALGADPANPMPLLQAKGESEQRLKHSGMAWTILQPDFYMDLLMLSVVGYPALAGTGVTLVGEGRRKHSLVAMTDVAEYAVAALTRASSDSADQTLLIGGPEPVSWREVVAVFERELGRPVPIDTVAIGEPVPGMPEMIAGLLAVLESYDSPLEMSELAARYGIRPTSLEDFVHRFVVSAAGSDAG